MSGTKGRFAERIRTFKTALGWHWELYDQMGRDQIGRSMSSFPSERLCLENAAQHGIPIPPEGLHLDEAAIRADIKLIEAKHAERQRLSAVGFSESDASSFNQEGGECEQKAYVYIVSSPPRNALIVKADTNLPDVILKRQRKSTASVASARQMETIVWIEEHETLDDAIIRQKAIQKWPRQRKIGFIEALNPRWEGVSHLIKQP
ncbi:hypothetical protein GB928_018235 [Shinella curvata]|uniref:GIY-YIG nuclease family protein n=1 Tax=Shinella curvata TaxID=1817964 RepID=A0ABT8XHC1_9HYPH|nr:hypothetical protein [Shinella curvata]MCJ8053799.1 hypothetical protein [Shinella curvata]MDO6123131.1 hypothetical protein [Shinella curvata]